jgi:hypothetical protein
MNKREREDILTSFFEDAWRQCWYVLLRNFWAQVAIAALLTREHRRWLAYGGLSGPGTGEI